VPPLRDDKVLADGNGLVIAALANAGAVLQRTDWTAAAIKAFDFVASVLGDGDRLYHSWHKGRRSDLAFADDYAQMIRAATVLWELVGDSKYLDCARRWTQTLNEHYWDNEHGGYFFTRDDADPLIVRTRMLFDQPAPSANATMIAQLARLYLATSDEAYAKRSDTLIQAFAGEAARAFNSTGSYFCSVEQAITALQIVIVGDQANHKTHELKAAVLGRSLPNRLLVVVSPDDALPKAHPAHGKTMQNGQPAAYICQRGTCSAPITNPVTLSQALQLPARAPSSQIQ
jgi:hypothetical protein